MRYERLVAASENTFETSESLRRIVPPHPWKMPQIFLGRAIDMPPRSMSGRSLEPGRNCTSVLHCPRVGRKDFRSADVDPRPVGAVIHRIAKIERGIHACIRFTWESDDERHSERNMETVGILD